MLTRVYLVLLARFCLWTAGQRLDHQDQSVGQKVLSGGLCRYGNSVECCWGWRQTDWGRCQPDCQQGCKHGECVGPDKCKCHPGYTGKTCNQDLNECGLKPRPCKHRCMNTHGSYKCYCLDGHTLQPDGSCRNARTCYHANCQYGCEVVKGTVRCTCPSPGLRLGPDRRTCIDVDECVLGGGVCPRRRKCVNTFGSFLCKCHLGFKLTYINGRYSCIDKDTRPFCSLNPSSPKCRCKDGRCQVVLTVSLEPQRPRTTTPYRKTTAASPTTSPTTSTTTTTTTATTTQRPASTTVTIPITTTTMATATLTTTTTTASTTLAHITTIPTTTTALAPTTTIASTTLAHITTIPTTTTALAPTTTIASTTLAPTTTIPTTTIASTTLAPTTTIPTTTIASTTLAPTTTIPTTIASTILAPTTTIHTTTIASTILAPTTTIHTTTIASTTLAPTTTIPTTTTTASTTTVSTTTELDTKNLTTLIPTTITTTTASTTPLPTTTTTTLTTMELTSTTVVEATTPATTTTPTTSLATTTVDNRINKEVTHRQRGDVHIPRHPDHNQVWEFDIELGNTAEDARDDPAAGVLSCSFDHGVCDWMSDREGDLHWQTVDNPAGGRYLSVPELKAGQRSIRGARLAVPLVLPWSHSDLCFSFSHWLTGHHVGVLQLFIRKKGRDQRYSPALWSRTGGHGWRCTQVTLTTHSLERVLLKAERRKGQRGEIAVDDITLRRGACR